MSEAGEGTEGVLMVKSKLTEEWWQEVKECGIVTKSWPRTCHGFLSFRCVSFMSPVFPLGRDEALSEAREKLKAAEEAESKAFAAAVAEWRRGSGPVTCERIG